PPPHRTPSRSPPPCCPIQPHITTPRPHPSRVRRGHIPIEGASPSSPPVTAASIHCSGRNATHEVGAPSVNPACSS
ncbi:Os05g0441500, partial [Oryza sativa Japonica Group]